MEASVTMDPPSPSRIEEYLVINAQNVPVKVAAFGGARGPTRSLGASVILGTGGMGLLGLLWTSEVRVIRS
jgi:hypothetical protein